MKSDRSANSGFPMFPKGPVEVSILCGLLFADWLVFGLVLWMSYDFGAQVRGGYYSAEQAVLYALEMGMILVLLSAIAWLHAMRRANVGTKGWLSWRVTWETAIIQIAYGVAVVARRQLWTPSQGINDGAMFLPVVGHINAHFFSEVGPIVFLIYVIPTTSVLSGLSYRLGAWLRFVRRSGSGEQQFQSRGHRGVRSRNPD